MKRMFFYLASLIVFSANILLPQDHSSEIKQAVEHFMEAKTLSDIDNGSLWGIKLYGPMILVNPQTRFIIANQQDKENFLEKNGEVYCGTLPKEVNIANTAINWKGEKWTMIISPLPQNKVERTSLMMHELFHRIQNQLNLPMYNTICKHLDLKDGRILMRLEWRELISALKAEGNDRLTFIKNAVVLNKYRKILYPGADSLERQLELNEGLAEYTGQKLCGAPESDLVNFTLQRISKPQNLPSLVRSFAYVSGPLYGLLLDKLPLQWRSKITKTECLTDMLEKEYGISLDNKLKEEAEKILNANKDSEIVIYENERDLKQKELIARLKDKFMNKPVLILPLQNMNMQFNPGNLVPLEDAGTVYPNIRITDNWGILNVTNEALMSSDFQSVLIALPDKLENSSDFKSVKSPDWTLELKTGWDFKPAKKEGCFKLTKEN